ncbi:MAG: Dephospho-CoA kinase, partial [Bacteroidota bacterium]
AQALESRADGRDGERFAFAALIEFHLDIGQRLANARQIHPEHGTHAVGLVVPEIIERVQKRDLISREAVLQRIANQWPDSKKMNLTTYIITNDGQPLLQQIEDVISKLKTA